MKFIKDRVYYRVRQALLKWNTYVLNQDENIRIYSTFLKSTTHTYKN
jgi:hypothetical protein